MSSPERTPSSWKRALLGPGTTLVLPLPWRAAVYVASTALIAFIAFTPFLLTWFLAPLWAAGLGRLERRRVRLLGKPTIIAPTPPTGLSPSSFFRQFREPQLWLETAYLAIFVVFAALSFVLMVLLAVTATVGVHAVLGYRAERTNAAAVWVASLHSPRPVTAVVAVLTFALILCLISALSAAQDNAARALLSSPARVLDQQVEQLTFSRRALLQGFEQERKRIERDLHDGAQQQLVNVSLHLGILELEIDDLNLSEPASARAKSALESARVAADDAVESLRQSIRGIYPAVLVDKGISAAVQELAMRSPIDVQVTLAIPRLSPGSEAALYFGVSEAITNAVRHAKATAIAVTGYASTQTITVQIVDNGIGGANPARGSGLSGLRERLDVLGGELELESPAGGPTTVQLTVPIAEL